MSSVGSAHLPHGDTATTRHGSRIWTDRRVLVGALIVVAALAIALTDYAGYGYAWSHLSRTSETTSGSTSEVFDDLKSRFRDYNTYSRDIFLMEERSKVDAHAFDPRDKALPRLLDEHFDRVWIALHGPGGEDGTLQGALEYLGVPYTGSGVMGSAIGMDKLRTKRLAQASGVSTA